MHGLRLYFCQKLCFSAWIYCYMIHYYSSCETWDCFVSLIESAGSKNSVFNRDFNQIELWLCCKSNFQVTISNFVVVWKDCSCCFNCRLFFCWEIIVLSWRWSMNNIVINIVKLKSVSCYGISNIRSARYSTVLVSNSHMLHMSYFCWKQYA